MDDCVAAGLPADRLRLVPLGVDVGQGRCRRDGARRRVYRLPQRYLLFVGTVEPRKNLRGLVEAMSRLDEPLPLVVAGAEGWGDVDMPSGGDVRFLGFVPAGDLAGLYAAPRCSATRASARATGCRCSRRWRRALRSSPAEAPRPRRPPAAPPCWSIRWILTTSPAASPKQASVGEALSADGFARARSGNVARDRRA